MIDFKIKEILKNRFSPLKLEVINESHLHANHKEAKKNPKAGHFRIIIVSDAFKNKSLIERHRMIYESLGDLMKTSIHALSIDAQNP